ncbi:hypothetical protein FB451DRAFT_1351789 [Mycena latifolia]|nr:hypothetical protein FB451DRAFT_1351789 [Mycena latifolia]
MSDEADAGFSSESSDGKSPSNALLRVAMNPNVSGDLGSSRASEWAYLGSTWPLRVLAELRMYELSWVLRSKPEWQRKAADPQILSKWRAEVLEQQKTVHNDQKLTENMVDYVLAELTGYANIADNERGIERGCFDAIWYSDRLISDDLTQRLKAAANTLENVPENEKDWHPGSNGQEEWAISQEFCWMPSDFTVLADGSVKLVSPYINNLHPSEHQPLYRIIEGRHGWRVLGEIDKEKKCGVEGKRSHQRCRLCLNLPEASTYAGELEQVLAPISLRGRTVQCIIKLANIHLTPEQPKYAGGSWHVEGMANEHIVASGIYYYDEENITESRLSFRVPTGQPEYHEQDDSECMKILYGIDRDEDCVQEIGSMVTKAGRALSWPNLFQHCLILAIFLVDPTIDPIASATDVPPQQAEWAAEALQQSLKDPQSLVSRLPQELVDLVKGRLSPNAMTRKEAEAYRLELMKERTAFVGTHSETAYGLKFNMCEH